jgi:hypothetical protein
LFKADDGRKRTKDEQENLHGKVQKKLVLHSDGDPGILFPHSRRAAGPAQERISEVAKKYSFLICHGHLLVRLFLIFFFLNFTRKAVTRALTNSVRASFLDRMGPGDVP